MTRSAGVRGLAAMLLGAFTLLLPASLYASTSTVTINGGEQHAGNGNWDAGSLSLTVDGHVETVSFGQFSTVQSVASGLAAKFSLDCHSPVQAHAVGSVITFTTKRMNVSFEQVSVAALWDTADFTQASFGIAQPQAPPATLTPSLALSCTPNPIPAGGSADCTAALPKGATGTVNFSIGTQSAWSTANVDGDGWAPASTLSGLQPGGSYTVAASYSGDIHYNPTSNNISVTVDSGALASATVYSYTITPTGGPSGYASNGNLLFYMDSVNGTWNVGASGYDGLNRLVAAAQTPVGSNTTQYWCWAYDSFGNRTVEATSSSALSGTACPTNGTGVSAHQYNASNQISSDPQIQYDAAGNTNADHDNQYLYDGDGRVCAVNNGLMMVQYIYDADGSRVAKGTITAFSCDTTVNGFQVTNSYVLGLGGEQVTEMNITAGQSTWAHTNIYAGGMLVATYDPLGLHFHLTDWLGNRRVQTNAFGQVEENCVNYVYGSGLVCAPPNGAPSTTDDATEHHFTGKERDAESGNDYFDARYYGSNMGRMMSPDPLPWAFWQNGNRYDQYRFQTYIANPQNFNMYAYVLNNPLSYTDPTGMTCQTNSSDGNTYDDMDGKGCATVDQQDADRLKNGQYDATVHGGSNAAQLEVNDAVGAFLGNGPKNIDYLPNDPFTLSFQKSAGMDAINAKITANCSASSGKFAVGSGEAFVNTLIDGLPFLGGEGFHTPEAQLGAFDGTYTHDGFTATVTVKNPISLNSASYHATDPIGIKNPTSGHLGTVNQTLHISEPDPCNGHT